MSTAIGHGAQPRSQQPRLSRRSRTALRIGSAAARLSRTLGFGGQMIGGRVALMLRPGCLGELARGRRVVLVSGTNGKTTTTAMLTAALRTAGATASNSSGANMLDGLTAAMATDAAPTFVGEVDELYLPTAVEQTDAAAVVLLNLSRDQLDRAGEIRRTVSRLVDLARQRPDLRVIANCDDPYVVLLAQGFEQVIWVSAGTRWHGDGGNCPRCGQRLHSGRADGHSADGHSADGHSADGHSADGHGADGHSADDRDWACGRCDLRRPRAHWRLEPDWFSTPDADRIRLNPRLPGEFNRANAAMAVAAGQALGVDPVQAAGAVSDIGGSAGRYQRIALGDHEVELLLAKNPAGWWVLLDLVRAHSGELIIAVNAREADGYDTSWLYDVDFEQLAGRQVIAAGERAPDLGVRLAYAGVEHVTVPDPMAALERLDRGRVLFVGDYTSFQQFRRTLRSQHDG